MAFGGHTDCLKDLSRFTINKLLWRGGLALSTVDENATTAESLFVSLLQQSTGQYSTLITAKQAIELALPDREAEQIQLKIRLARVNKEKRTGPIPPSKSFFTDVVSLLPSQYEIPSASSAVTMIKVKEEGIVIVVLNVKKPPSGDDESSSIFYHFWQEPNTGLFRCITLRKKTFANTDDYVDALLRDVIHLRDLFYNRLKIIPDKDVEGEAIKLAGKLMTCEKPNDYLTAVTEDYEIKEEEKWKLLVLEELESLGQLSQTIEEDLKEKIIECLAQAAEDTYVKRKKDYETEIKEKIDREIQKEKESKELEHQKKINEKEIAQLESEIEKSSSDLTKTKKQLKQYQQKADEIKEEEQKAIQALNKKISQKNQEVEASAKQRAHFEKEIDQLGKELSLAFAQQKAADCGIHKHEQQLDLINQSLQNKRAAIEEKKKTLNQLKEKENQLKMHQQSLNDELKEVGELAKRELQNLNNDLARIQQLISKRETNAWLNLKLQLNQCIPPYNLFKTRRNTVFINRLDTEQKLNNVNGLVDYVINELELKIDHKMDLKSYVGHLSGAEQSVKDLITTAADLVTEPQYDMVQQSRWRVSGPVLLLSQILSRILEKKNRAGNSCQEIHICASRVIYVDCDWFISGMSVALSAPHVRVEGASIRTIKTSGNNAEEFSDRQAKHGNSTGLSGEHGKDGAAGGTAGHFSISCAHLSNGQLQVVANGGYGADGQHGGNGANGQNGYDGSDGEIDSPKSADEYDINVWGVDKYKVANGKSGKSGTPGGNGGWAGTGGQGGHGGHIFWNISATGKSNFCKPENSRGADGRQGNAGEGGRGGYGGRNGLDRAQVHNTYTWLPGGKWTGIESGDLIIRSYRKYGEDIYYVEKRASDNGRASNGENGHRGKSAAEQKRMAATTKQMISEVQHIWNSDAINNKTQKQERLSEDELKELSRREQSVRQSRALLLQKQSDIQQTLSSVKNQMTTVNKIELIESDERKLAGDIEQLEAQKRDNRRELQQQYDQLNRSRAEEKAKKTAIESRQAQTQQIAHSAAQSQAQASIDIAETKSLVSQIKEEAKRVDSRVLEVQKKTKSIESNRDKQEKALMERCQAKQRYSDAIVKNERSIRELHQRQLKIEEEKNKLATMEELKEKILKTARSVTQHKQVCERNHEFLEEITEFDDGSDESLLAYSGIMTFFHNIFHLLNSELYLNI